MLVTVGTYSKNGIVWILSAFEKTPRKQKAVDFLEITLKSIMTHQSFFLLLCTLKSTVILCPRCIFLRSHDLLHYALFTWKIRLLNYSDFPNVDTFVLGCKNVIISSSTTHLTRKFFKDLQIVKSWWWMQDFPNSILCLILNLKKKSQTTYSISFPWDDGLTWWNVGKCSQLNFLVTCPIQDSTQEISGVLLCFSVAVINTMTTKQHGEEQIYVSS